MEGARLAGALWARNAPARPVKKRLRTGPFTGHRAWARSSSEQAAMTGWHPWRTASRLVRSTPGLGLWAGAPGEGLPASLPTARRRRHAARRDHRRATTRVNERAWLREQASARLRERAAVWGSVWDCDAPCCVWPGAVYLLSLVPCSGPSTSCPPYIGGYRSSCTLSSHIEPAAAVYHSPGWVRRLPRTGLHFLYRYRAVRAVSSGTSCRLCTCCS